MCSNNYITLYPDVSILIKQNFLLQDQWQLPVSFFIVFVSSFLLLSVIVYYLKKNIHPSVQKNSLNRITGIIPGFFTGVVIAAIMSPLFTVCVNRQYTIETKKSLLSASLNKSTAWFKNKINIVFNLPVEQETSSAFEAGPGLNESDEFGCGNFCERSDPENQLLHLVNKERIKHGVKSVITDMEMKKAATEHATDMFTRGYFSHDTPEGTDPFERMKKLGIKFMFAGENLAHSSNLFSAYKGLMQSPGHRANILNPAFGKLGISILDGGPKGLMIVQEFKD